MADDAKTVAERPRSGDRSEPRPVRDPSRLSERYVSGATLGEGGMGRVVEATDTLLGRTVAVKQAHDLDQLALRRFHRETMITARLEHPSIVPVYDAGRAADGSPFYVMRKVSGRPLDELVTAADTLSERLALLPHLVAAAQAVAHAHERGVIHRDLKPTNLLVGTHGETIVIDWGLAKVVDEPPDADDADAPITERLDAGSSLRTRAGAVIGTPGFMPPEQLRSDDVDARADVYALGATLYYMLARKPPHAAPTADGMVEAALAGPPKPIEEIVDDVPAELATIVRKALAYDDRVRYADAAALATDLRRFLAGQLVASHHYSTTEHVVRFIKRHRVSVAVCVAATVALVVIGAIAFRRVVAARDQAVHARDEAVAQEHAAELARQREAERTTDATFAHARVLLAVNPTAAVAVVKPLVTGPRWREARAIAAEARSAGVAWRLAGPERPAHLAMLPDGLHAVSIGDDGELWLHDLAARTGHRVITLSAPLLVAPIDDHTVAAYDLKSPRLVIVDLAAATTRDIAVTSPVQHVAGVAGAVWWTDATHHASRLLAGGTAFEPVDVGEPVTLISPSPDGKLVALGGEQHLWLLGGAKPESLFAGRVHALTWSADSARIGAIIDNLEVEITLSPRQVARAQIPGQLSIVLAGGTRYTSGFSGISVGDRIPNGWPVESHFLDLHRCYGDHVLTANQDSSLTLITRDRRQLIPSALAPFVTLACSSQSPYAVTIHRDAVLLWDLAPLVPTEIPWRPESAIATSQSAGHLVLVTRYHEPASWLDLATHEITPGPDAPFPAMIADTWSGDSAIMTSLDGKASLIHPRGSDLTPFANDVALDAMLDEDHAAIVQRNGDVSVVGLRDHSNRALGRFPGKPRQLLTAQHASPWVVLVYEDKTVRIDTQTGHASTLPQAFEPGRALVTASGAMFFLDDRAVRRSDASATAVHAELPASPGQLANLDDHRALVSAGADSYLVNLDAAGPVTPTGLAAPDGFELAPEGGLVVAAQESGGVALLDAAAPTAPWHIARALRFSDIPHVSRDGRFLYVFRDDRVEIWPIERPASATETAVWVDGMTNATAGLGAALTWMLQPAR